MALGVSPMQTTMLESPQRIEQLLNIAAVTRQIAGAALRSNHNDVHKALAALIESGEVTVTNLRRRACPRELFALAASKAPPPNVPPIPPSARLLSFNCSHEDIRKLVVEWWELIAVGNYRQAIDMFPHDDREISWSAETLRTAIATYGVFTPFPDDPQWEPASIFAQPNPQAIINSIDVDRENIYGLDQREYDGMVHFDDVPLKQRISDMTARFHIRRVGENAITLEFLDIHVM